jgi:hypothetical protein
MSTNELRSILVELLNRNSAKCIPLARLTSRVYALHGGEAASRSSKELREMHAEGIVRLLQGGGYPAYQLVEG